MVRNQPLPDQHLETVWKELEEQGYEPRETAFTDRDGNRYEKTNFTKDPLNSTLVYDQDTGALKELRIALPDNIYADSEMQIEDISPANAFSAFEYIQDDNVEIEEGRGSKTAIFEPQETPEETLEYLNRGIAAMNTLADFKEALE